MQTIVPERGDEYRRLKALRALRILDSGPEAAFDDIAACITRACGTPIAFVSLIDEHRQWSKAKLGMDVSETDRSLSFCTHVIESDHPFLISDATRDTRFCDNPFVTAEGGVRAYAGAPLITSDGHRLGAVCAVDVRPRRWTAAQVAQLESLARLTVKLIEHRAEHDRLNRRAAQVQRMFWESRRHRKIFRSVTEGVILHDQSGAVIDANPSALRILRLRREDLLGSVSSQSAWCLVNVDGHEIPPEQHPALLALATGEAQHEAIIGIVKPSGSRRWLRVNAEPLFRDDEGRPIQVVATFTDITAIRAAAITLKNKERDLRQLLQALPTAVYTVDDQGLLTFYNDAAAELWGRRPELGVTRWTGAWKMLSADGTELPPECCAVAVCVREGRPVRNAKGVTIRPDGASIVVQPFATPLIDGEGRLVGAVNMLIDISRQEEEAGARERLIEELKQSRAALTDALAAAQAGGRAKSAFLANMSHELRTPLNGVVGVAGALAATPLSPAQSDMVDLIVESGHTLERLLTDILDWSKVEADAVVLEERPFHLTAIVESACELMRLRAEEKGLAFTHSVQSECGPAFVGDALRLKQIIGNLLTNAIKFTDSGAVALYATVTPGVGEQSVLTLRVVDTGVGFDPAAADRLFERFEQADASITRRYGGTGLGLAITKALVDAMGGTITAASDPGHGSTFCAQIPLRATEAALLTAGPSEPAPRDESIPEAGLRLLLAEDHPTNQRVVKLILEPLGVDLTIVENGAEAIEACRKTKFDLVLMDVQMPVMDGLTAVRAIRAREAAVGLPRLPIAMLSANALEEHRQASVQAGADVHICKPVTPQTLTDGIDEALALGDAQNAAAVRAA